MHHFGYNRHLYTDRKTWATSKATENFAFEVRGECAEPCDQTRKQSVCTWERFGLYAQNTTQKAQRIYGAEISVGYF